MMKEGGPPSSKIASSPLPQTQRTPFNPLLLLQCAVDYGEATWSTICENKDSLSLTSLLNLTYIIEEHIQNLVTLCSLYKDDFSHNNSTLQLLLSFYSSPKIYTPLHLLSQNFSFQFFSNSSTSTLHHTHYYNNLATAELTQPEYTPFISMASSSPNPPFNAPVSPIKKPPPSQPSYFVEDLGISEISDIVLNQVQLDQATMEEEEGVQAAKLLSPLEKLTLETPNQQRLRINLIRHRFARTTEIKTILLFKSFITALRKVDSTLLILPIDSRK
jgi:hypothetical protein